MTSRYGNRSRNLLSAPVPAPATANEKKILSLEPLGLLRSPDVKRNGVPRSQPQQVGLRRRPRLQSSRPTAKRDPQEPELNPEPPEKKRSGPLERFLDDKPQESLDAINSLIEEMLQEIKTSIEANARTLVAQIFWLAVAAELTASLITLTLVKAAFPFIKWILRKILNGIRDAKFIQAFNAELQTTTQEEPKHDATSKARLVYRRSLRWRPRFVSVSVFSRRKRRSAPRAVVINTKKFLVFSLKIALKSGILNSVAAARPIPNAPNAPTASANRSTANPVSPSATQRNCLQRNDLTFSRKPNEIRMQRPARSVESSDRQRLHSVLPKTRRRLRNFHRSLLRVSPRIL